MTKGLCIYCGKEATTDDHVPPKNLFPKPRPANLITVPSCDVCNKSASKDDEYFMSKVSLNSKGDQEAARPTWQKTLRALNRPEAAGLREAHIKDIAGPVATRSGVTLAYSVDFTRIAAVIKRIVRGLYWHELQKRMPLEQQICILADEHIPQLSSDLLNYLEQNVVRQLGPGRTIGQNVFSYRFKLDDDGGSAWLLCFYAGVSFLCVSAPSQSKTC